MDFELRDAASSGGPARLALPAWASSAEEETGIGGGSPPDLKRIHADLRELGALQQAGQQRDEVSELLRIGLAQEGGSLDMDQLLDIVGGDDGEQALLRYKRE